MKKFIFATMFFGLSCSAADPGVTATEVRFGAHTTESGPLAILGMNPRAADAYLTAINKAGGVHGRQIKFIRIDTQGVMIKSVQATKKLVEEDKVFGMFNSLGASHQAVYKYLAEKNVPDAFFFDGLQEYAQPVKKSIFPGQLSFSQEGAALAKIAATQFKGKRTCFINTDNSQGGEFHKGAKEVFDNENKTLQDGQKIVFGAVERVDRMATQANTSVTALQKDKCEVVLLSVLGSLPASVISFGSLQGFKPVWMTISMNASDKMLSLLPEAVRDGIYSTTLYAIDETYGVPGWSDYLKLMKSASLPVTKLTVAGYASAEVLVETLKRAGKNLTRESFIQAADSLSDFTCSVCVSKLAYSKTNHWGYQNPVGVISKAGKWNKLP